MVAVAQLARASACGAEGCRIVPDRPPSDICKRVISFVYEEPPSWYRFYRPHRHRRVHVPKRN